MDKKKTTVVFSKDDNLNFFQDIFEEIKDVLNDSSIFCADSVTLGMFVEEQHDDTLNKLFQRHCLKMLNHAFGCTLPEDAVKMKLGDICDFLDKNRTHKPTISVDHINFIGIKNLTDLNENKNFRLERIADIKNRVDERISYEKENPSQIGKHPYQEDYNNDFKWVYGDTPCRTEIEESPYIINFKNLNEFYNWFIARAKRESN